MVEIIAYFHHRWNFLFPSRPHAKIDKTLISRCIGVVCKTRKIGRIPRGTFPREVSTKQTEKQWVFEKLVFEIENRLDVIVIGRNARESLLSILHICGSLNEIMLWHDMESRYYPLKGMKLKQCGYLRMIVWKPKWSCGSETVQRFIHLTMHFTIRSANPRPNLGYFSTSVIKVSQCTLLTRSLTCLTKWNYF